MELFNFDHGLCHPHTLHVGPFCISVTASHCKNLEHLPRRESRTFTHAEDGARVVLCNPISRGAFLPTAELELLDSSKMPPSVLFPDWPEVDASYDLVVLLSFLTGRRVYLTDELDWDPRRSYGEPIVNGIDLVYYANQAWSALPKISSLGLGDAVACLVNAPLSPDLIGWGAYVNAAFESIVTSWAKNHGKTAYHDSAQIAKAREALERTLIGEGVSTETTRDIIARFNQIKSPSALYKISLFVQACGVFPENPSEEQFNRLRRLNKVRNSIAHSGTVRVERELGARRSIDVAAATVLLTHEIADLYLAREILGITSTGIEKSALNIRKFFDVGLFRNQSVLDEAYEEYLARLEKSWLDYGLLETA